MPARVEDVLDGPVAVRDPEPRQAVDALQCGQIETEATGLKIERSRCPTN